MLSTDSPRHRHVLAAPALVLSAVFLWACGGGEDSQADGGSAESDAAVSTVEEAPAPAAPVPPTGDLQAPEWFSVDHDARTVAMTLTAGTTNANNYWNYMGTLHGELSVTVPVGYEVSIDFVNNDQVMAHSVGVSEGDGTFGATVEAIAVFEGAMTGNPTSMIDGTMPGESQTISFTAERAGTYLLVCYIAGHAITGMWGWFIVSEDGSAGVIGA